MRVVIAGAHGRIARLFGRLLVERGDVVVGLIRNPSHADELRADGVSPVVVDLEAVAAADLVDALAGADAVVFAAGAGPGSGVARKDTVDRAASVLLASACELAGVRRFLQISALRVDAPPPDVGEVFASYLSAKRAAEEDLRTRPLDWTILRPGLLTDAPPTGRVHLADHVERAEIPRADVAAVLVALLDDPGSAGLTLELVGGEVPIPDAVQAVARR